MAPKRRNNAGIATAVAETKAIPALNSSRCVAKRKAAKIARPSSSGWRSWRHRLISPATSQERSGRLADFSALTGEQLAGATVL